MKKQKMLIKGLRRYIGMRTLKTVIAVALCFFVYELRGRQGIPFYSALSAIWCIRPDIHNSKDMAIQRFAGTLIGAFYGLIIILLENRYFPDLDEVAGYLVATAVLIPVIVTTVALRKKESSFFACAVFLSITINHLKDPSPYLFVFNRVCDTAIGIIIALLVNIARLPYHKNNEVLYVSGLDEVLLTHHDRFPDFSRRELNRMLDEGMHFAVATMRTPASLITPLQDIHMKLPIIAMDGTVLFSMKENAYLKTFPMKHDVVNEITAYLDQENVHYFINTILQDTLFIYYGEFRNEAEAQLFDKLKVSPYRNYLNGYPREYEDVVYFTLLLEAETAMRLDEAMGSQTFSDQIRWQYYPSPEYPGYEYIKIYDVDSSREKMVEYLKAQVGVEKSISFGSIPGKTDICTSGASAEEVVRILRRQYELPLWQRK